jgi:hypothetical protein
VILHLPTDHLIQAIDDPIERLTARQVIALMDELVRRGNQEDDELANDYLEYVALEAQKQARHEA